MRCNSSRTLLLRVILETQSAHESKWAKAESTWAVQKIKMVLMCLERFIWITKPTSSYEQPLRQKFPEWCKNVLDSWNSQIPNRLVSMVSIKNVKTKWIYHCSHWSYIGCLSAWGKDWAQCVSLSLLQKYPIICHLHVCMLAAWTPVSFIAIVAKPAVLQNDQIFGFRIFKNFTKVVIHLKSYIEHVQSKTQNHISQG